jgi:RND family efflux transporter MFP subunit
MRKNISYLLYSAGLMAVAAGIVAAAEPARGPAAGGRARGIAAPAPVVVPTGEQSFTKASEERDLAFNQPGLVAKVTVKQDEHVKAGQLLAEQDFTVEKANKATFEIEANSLVEEEYAVADLDIKKVELKRKEDLFNNKNKAVNQLEVEEARLAVKRAEAQVKLAKQKRATAAAQAAVEQAKIDLKRIISPIDGVVQKLDTHVGEVANNAASEKPAIRVVRADPLWIDVNFPAEQAAKLKVGQAMQVAYVADQNKWIQAEVLSLQPVVKSGSQTRAVRLVMPNPDRTPPGLEVVVKLPDPTVAAAQTPAGSDR